MLIGIFSKFEILKRVAYGLFIFTALISIPTNLSGEEAEEIVADIQGIDHDLLEEHEEAANFGLWAAIIVGIVSVVGLILSLKNNDLKGVISFIVFAGSLLAIFYMWQVGLSGGKIRHPEININADTQNEKEHTD